MSNSSLEKNNSYIFLSAIQRNNQKLPKFDAEHGARRGGTRNKLMKTRLEGVAER
jgi:hypothetical protein